MLRSNVLRSFRSIRTYATDKPAALSIEAQLDSLLARVDALSTNSSGQKQKNQKNQFRRSVNKKFVKQPHQYQTGEAIVSKKATPPQAKPRASQSTNEFGALFTDFVGSDHQPNFHNQPQRKQQQSKFPSKPRRQQQRASNGSSQKSNFSSPRPKRRTNNQRRDSTPVSNKNLPLKNPNIDAIATSYAPEPANITELMLSSPLTSQTRTSRIIKAYQRLAEDGDADVSGILTGKFDNSIASSKILPQLKTPALKLNGQTVINSLNGNSSIDYETKEKLLKPLVGLAPVKELSA